MLNAPIIPDEKDFSSTDINRLRDYLIDRVTPDVDAEKKNSEKYRALVAQIIQSAYDQIGLHLPKEISERVINMAFNEIVGYGPIQSLLDDPEVSEVMVNGPFKVYVEKKGKLIKTGITFESNEHV